MAALTQHHDNTTHSASVKRPLAFFLAFCIALPATFIVLGLWQVGWSWAALPLWYWGAGLLFGLLCMAGMFLMFSAKPHLPYATRTLRLAAAYGLPFTCWTLSSEGLRGELTPANLSSALLLQIPVALVVALMFGAVFASLQQRKAT